MENSTNGSEVVGARKSRLRVPDTFRALFRLVPAVTCFGLFGWCGYRAVQRVRLSRPLVDAVKHSDTEAVRALLDRGADAATRDVPAQPITWETVWNALWRHDTANSLAAPVLQRAATVGNVEIVRLLIAHGADVNAESADWPVVRMSAAVPSEANGMPRGYTALMAALSAYNNDVARLLLKCGADPNRHPASEPTPLMLAMLPGESGAGRMEERSRTPPKGIVRLLLERGADVRTILPNGDTALRLAIDSNRSAIPLLVLKGGDPNTRAHDKWRRTLLIEAAVMEDSAAIKFLVEHGADVNATDAEGRTALMEVGRRLNGDDFPVEAARAVLEHHANVNARDQDGYTALMEAAGVGRGNAQSFDAVKLFIEHGADPERIDKSGRTAFQKLPQIRQRDEYSLRIAKLLNTSHPPP